MLRCLIILYVNPSIWIINKGDAATRATIPKADLMMFTSRDVAAPMARGSKKHVVMTPEAAPPESKAITVNILGVTRVSIITNMYIGIMKYSMDIPVSTLVSDNNTAMATPIDRQKLISFLDMLPPVMFSICSVKIFTDGSAVTEKYPIIIPRGKNKLLYSDNTILFPMLYAIFKYPTLAPVKNRVKPINVRNIPRDIFFSFLGVYICFLC